jgi:hypothetical protein
MVIDAILQPGEPFSVSAAGCARERSSARSGRRASPDEQDSALAELHVVVVLPDHTSALRHKQDTAGWAVVDVSVTCAVIWPGRSDRMPVISAADITAPA